MPTRDTAWPNGTPCWVDYGAPDVDAAKTFYAANLGWTFEGGRPEFGGYLTCMRHGGAAAGMSPMRDPSIPPRWNMYFATDDRPLGGLGPRWPGGPAGWTTCFSVADTDDAVETAVAGGAKVLMAAQDTPYGRFAVMTDPSGVAFSVMQAPAG